LDINIAGNNVLGQQRTPNNKNLQKIFLKVRFRYVFRPQSNFFTALCVTKRGLRGLGLRITPP